MRAHTKGKHEMGKRFAIVIGTAAAGVMALGVQTVLAGGDRAPDLKLSGEKKQSLGIGPKCIDSCGVGDRPVAVIASCGEFRGPPASPEESVPPANLPDLGCHLSAEGKVTKVKNGTLKPGLQARGVDLPGPHVLCKGDSATPAHDCRWHSGSRAWMALKPGRKTFKQVRKALDDGKTVKAKVTVRAKYASGKVETAKRTIRLVK